MCLKVSPIFELHAIFMSLKSFLLTILFSFILEIIISPIRAYLGGFPVSCVVGFIAFFVLTTFFSKRFSSKISLNLIFLGVTLGLFIIQIPIRILDFDNTLISLPDFICHFLGIVCGWTYMLLKGFKKWVPFSLGLVFSVFLLISGYDYWLFKLNFGTFTGKVHYKQPIHIIGRDQNNRLITDDEMKGKLVLLDFWHTRCGVCFEKFPKVQSLYDQFKFDTSFILYAVNKPLKQDSTGQAFSMLKERKYTFPILIPTIDKLPEAFGAVFYPTVVIINKTGTVIYRGDIEHSAQIIKSLTKNGM